LTQENFDEGALTVAGGAGYADDFAGLDLQTDRINGQWPVVACGKEPGEFEHRVQRLLRRRTPGALAQPRIADHQMGHVLGGHIADLAAVPATARTGSSIGTPNGMRPRKAARRLRSLDQSMMAGVATRLLTKFSAAVSEGTSVKCW